jgi:hypothetical protein
MFKSIYKKIQDKHVFNTNIIKKILTCILIIYSNLQCTYNQSYSMHANNKNNND